MRTRSRTSAATSRVGGGNRGVWPALRVLVDRRRAIFIALSVLFQTKAVGRAVRASVLHKTLRVGWQGMAYCDAQVVCALGVDGDARAAPVNYLSMSSSACVFRVDVSGGLLAACEVAVARRCAAPVVSGRVPPAVAPWSCGRAGEPRRTLLALAAPKALAAKLRRLPGAPRAAFRTAQIVFLVSYMPLVRRAVERGAPKLHTGHRIVVFSKPAKAA